MSKKIVIAGGSGFIGKEIKKYFETLNYKVVILTTKKALCKNGEYIYWDGVNMGAWAATLDGCHAVINLAGKSVNCRYNEQNRRAILTSRLRSTELIGEAIQNTQRPPKYWINASTATIYRHSEDMNMTERDGEIGDGFSVEVAKRWERAFFSFKFQNIKQIALRIAIVLGKEGGVIPELEKIVKIGMGGTQGGGHQYISWIHIEDMMRIIEYVLTDNTKAIVINCAAPNAVTNKYFMQTLRYKMNRSFGITLPTWLLKIGALLKGTETELLLKSRRVYPQNLLVQGFKFNYPNVNQALESLIN
ncbi:MAG: TIGR01777 family oxidoreductase [Flavobacteriales bacterium]|nr:TIGR01777 family oxidoreductase [Flavobacteriales bacterium]